MSECEIEKYREEHESEEHWNLRKAFLLRWRKNYEEERLLCLARVFINIELMGCRYPPEVMKEVSGLSEEVVKSYRDKRKNKLKRTFVSASDAAEDRAKGVKRQGGIIVDSPPAKNARIAFVPQGHSVADDSRVTGNLTSTQCIASQRNGGNSSSLASADQSTSSANHTDLCSQQDYYLQEQENSSTQNNLQRYKEVISKSTGGEVIDIAAENMSCSESDDCIFVSEELACTHQSEAGTRSMQGFRAEFLASQYYGIDDLTEGSFSDAAEPYQGDRECLRSLATTGQFDLDDPMGTYPIEYSSDRHWSLVGTQPHTTLPPTKIKRKLSRNQKRRAKKLAQRMAAASMSLTGSSGLEIEASEKEDFNSGLSTLKRTQSNGDFPSLPPKKKKKKNKHAKTLITSVVQMDPWWDMDWTLSGLDEGSTEPVHQSLNTHEDSIFQDNSLVNNKTLDFNIEVSDAEENETTSNDQVSSESISQNNQLTSGVQDYHDYLKELEQTVCLDVRHFREDMFNTRFGKLVLMVKPWINKLDNICGSCSMCKLERHITYEEGLYSLYINQVMVAQAVGGSKAEARGLVEAMAWDRLRRECVNVYVREQWIAQGDSKITNSDVTHKSGRQSQLEQFGTPIESSVATKMMKLMGWAGGGLGAGAQGIEEPVKPHLQMVNRAGLGSNSTGRHFHQAATELMRRYSSQDTLDVDLVFSSCFSKEERAKLHQIAKRSGLASHSYGKDDDRFLVVRKKSKDPFDLVRDIIDKGGNTAKYQIFIPNTIRNK